MYKFTMFSSTHDSYKHFFTKFAPKIGNIYSNKEKKYF